MTLNSGKLVLFVSFIVWATVAKAQEVDLGLKAGIYTAGFTLVNNIQPNPTLKAQGSFNFSYGVNAVIKLKSDDQWEIWLEPGLIKKGGAIDYTFNSEFSGIPFEDRYIVSYTDIEMPVILNLHIKGDFYLNAGIGIGYTLSTERRVPPGRNNDEDNFLPDLNHKLNASIIAGLNYNLSDYYALSLRYTTGINSVMTGDLVALSKYKFPYTATQTSIYSNSLQLSLIYSFNL